MLQRLLLIGTLLSLVVFLTATINPAISLADLPNCIGFAGENAMRSVNGVTHLTYLSFSGGFNNAIIYAKIQADNTFESYTVDAFDVSVQQIILPRNLPTLEVVGTTIYVFYTKDSQLTKAVSTDGGTNFTISTVEPATDTMPVIQKHDGYWSAFITPNDAYADSSYEYFTNVTGSTNGSPVYFWGQDVLYGAVRSNEDIWIRQMGGGANNGWPTFYGPVYTSGIIQSIAGTPPYEIVFRGGYFEHVPVLTPDFQTMNWQIHNEGQFIGENILSENKITFVTVYGNAYTSWTGTIVQTGFDTLWVYSNYPPGTGTPLFANIVPHADTIWASGPCGPCSDMINIVNTPLWIKGIFAGKQTWYSPYNIMINNDILLSDTPVGQVPSPQSSDYVALVSDKQILVQYGYKDPVDLVRYRPNCDGDSLGVFIYASLFAVRPDRFGNIKKDGSFTFEYQHPHPAMFDVTMNEVFYEKIDMHRRYYPQTTSNLWPGNVDYPYYNPIWPEAWPLMERGTIHLYGSVFQQRKGFMHRNVSDTEIPNPSNIWDIENELCGGPSGAAYTDPVLGLILSGINAPNTTGSGVGYKKDYHADLRQLFTTFPFNPFGLGMKYKTSIDGENWTLRYFKSLNEPVESKILQMRNGSTAWQLNQHVVWQADAEAEANELDIAFPDNEKLQSMIIQGNNNLLLKTHQTNAAAQDSVRLVTFNPVTNAIQAQYSLPSFSQINSLFNMSGAMSFFANLLPDGSIQFYAPDFGGIMQTWTVWNPQIGELASLQIDLEKSRLVILSGNADSIFVLVCLSDLSGNNFHLYYAKGELEYTHNQDTTEPALKINTKIYPNPFQQNLTLQIETNKSVKAALSVYNIKGQKVKTISQDTALSKGVHDLYWSGTDDYGKTVSNGVYFLKGKIGTQSVSAKVLLLK